MNDAEKEKMESANEHKHKSIKYHDDEEKVKALQKELKKAIAKSRSVKNYPFNFGTFCMDVHGLINDSYFFNLRNFIDFIVPLDVQLYHSIPHLIDLCISIDIFSDMF